MSIEDILPKTIDWVAIEDNDSIKKILESYLDPDRKKIISCVISESKISSKILQECELPRSSGYRTLKTLIDDGLLFAKDTIKFPNGAIAKKYISTLSGLKIDINENKISIKVQRNPASLSKTV